MNINDKVRRYTVHKSDNNAGERMKYAKRRQSKQLSGRSDERGQR
jgi:hypothetical protein